MNGYYVLAERAEWWKVPSYCSSPCVYVKWSDMNMTDTGYGMGGFGSGMMEGSGYGSGMGMDKEMKDEDKMMMMMKLQKYCFQPSQDTQAMCAADEGIQKCV